MPAFSIAESIVSDCCRAALACRQPELADSVIECVQAASLCSQYSVRFAKVPVKQCHLFKSDKVARDVTVARKAPDVHPFSEHASEGSQAQTRLADAQSHAERR
jgi:hypothetical protein